MFCVLVNKWDNIYKVYSVIALFKCSLFKSTLFWVAQLCVKVRIQIEPVFKNVGSHNSYHVMWELSLCGSSPPPPPPPFPNSQNPPLSKSLVVNQPSLLSFSFLFFLGKCFFCQKEKLKTNIFWKGIFIFILRVSMARNDPPKKEFELSDFYIWFSFSVSS